MLEQYIRSRREQKDLLLMTHIVLGYPSFDDSLRMVEVMVEAGVDLMELQIPFSEPMADGPVILKANADALSAGARVDRSFELAEKISASFDIPFLFMTYYNILFHRGVEAFVRQMAEIGIRGSIVPDLPPEEGSDYLAAMKNNSLAPIHIFTPNSSDQRLVLLSDKSAGFIYAVARKGVTGKATAFSDDLGEYLSRCRAATSLPLALGFGVKSREDVDFIRGKADIAVVGSETIRVLDCQGIDAVGPFISQLVG
ncbi:MAG: tryptophan synthase subunit alpha [Gammaproteobacteria bacterium]|nr:tryptophan synthase subunit alpha [Gammaproteobacteria bacterium]